MVPETGSKSAIYAIAFSDLAKALQNIPVEERILVALFFCSQQPNDILAQLKEEWNDKVGIDFFEKHKLVSYHFIAEEIFAAVNELSIAIDKNSFILSHFKQPDFVYPHTAWEGNDSTKQTY